MNCALCGNPFIRRNYRSKYCSRECLREANRTRLVSPTLTYPGVDISTGTRGAIGELEVALDLMKRGFHVFRAMSPSCPCDLMIWKEGWSACRVEVKTAAIHVETRAVVLPVTSTNRYDIIAYLTADGIIYDPPVELW